MARKIRTLVRHFRRIFKLAVGVDCLPHHPQIGIRPVVGSTRRPAFDPIKRMKNAIQRPPQAPTSKQRLRRFRAARLGTDRSCSSRPPDHGRPGAGNGIAGFVRPSGRADQRPSRAILKSARRSRDAELARGSRPYAERFGPRGRRLRRRRRRAKLRGKRPRRNVLAPVGRRSAGPAAVAEARAALEAIVGLIPAVGSKKFSRHFLSQNAAQWAGPVRRHPRSEGILRIRRPA